VPRRHLKGRAFTKVIPGFVAQGVQGVNSVYGAQWEEETFAVKHDAPGVGFPRL